MGGGGFGGMGFSPSRGGAGGYNRPGNFAGGGMQGGGRPYGNFPSSTPLPGARNPALGQRPAGGNNAFGPNRNFAGGAGRPSANQLNNFLDIPRPTPGGANFNRGNFDRADFNRGNSAAADFLNLGGGNLNWPSQLPGGNNPFRMGGEPAFGNAGGGVRANGAPGAAGRPAIDRVANARETGGGLRPATNPAANNARQNLAQNHPNQIQNRQQWQQNRQQRRDQVRQQVKDHNPGDWWRNHPGWAAYGLARAYNYATYGAAAAWFGWGTIPYVSYDYGNNVYYSDGQVYNGSQPIATEAEYAQQASAIAAAAPETPPAEPDQWLPLGVFAVTQDGQSSGEQPALYVQLAVSKQGVIGGTQKHMATGKIDTLSGTVDKESQRAAWGVKGKPFPIIETGIYNLTQDAAPASIHFADGQTQQWLLVRLEKPNDSSDTTTAPQKATPSS
jgi:hypothetical protein